MKNISSAKKACWKQFSYFIRLRDCLITTGTKEKGACVTCGKVYPLKSLQAGHFIAGRGNSILFEEHNCHAQCYACNVVRGGEQFIHGQKVEDFYGKKEVERLSKLKNEARKFTLDELEELTSYYREEVKQMLEGN